jgi:hypothetical protein
MKQLVDILVVEFIILVLSCLGGVAGFSCVLVVEILFTLGWIGGNL